MKEEMKDDLKREKFLYKIYILSGIIFLAMSVFAQEASLMNILPIGLVMTFTANIVGQGIIILLCEKILKIMKNKENGINI